MKKLHSEKTHTTNKDFSYKRNGRKQYNKNNFHSHKEYRQRSSSDHDHTMCGHDHGHTFFEEILCHIPLSIMAFCLSLITLFGVTLLIKAGSISSKATYNSLFHILHYSHTLFAAVGVMISLYRFVYKPKWSTVLITSIIPLIFCTASDIIFPSLGGSLFGVEIPMHLCFSCPHDLRGLLCFWIAGIIAGISLAKGSGDAKKSFVSLFHFGHVFLGVVATFSYLLLHGMEIFTTEYYQLFILSVLSTIIPCTLSDTIIPLFIGLFKKKSHNVYRA